MPKSLPDVPVPFSTACNECNDEVKPNLYRHSMPGALGFSASNFQIPRNPVPYQVPQTHTHVVSSTTTRLLPPIPIEVQYSAPLVQAKSFQSFAPTVPQKYEPRVDAEMSAQQPWYPGNHAPEPAAAPFLPFAPASVAPDVSGYQLSTSDALHASEALAAGEALAEQDNASMHTAAVPSVPAVPVSERELPRVDAPQIAPPVTPACAAGLPRPCIIIEVR